MRKAYILDVDCVVYQSTKSPGLGIANSPVKLVLSWTFGGVTRRSALNTEKLNVVPTLSVLCTRFVRHVD